MMARIGVQLVMNGRWNKYNQFNRTSSLTGANLANFKSITIHYCYILPLLCFFSIQIEQLEIKKSWEGCIEKKQISTSNYLVALPACKWESLQKNLSHYHSHKYEANLDVPRPFVGVLFWMWFSFISGMYRVPTRRFLLKMSASPGLHSAVKKLTIKNSTSS